MKSFIPVSNAPTLQQLAQNYFTPGPSVSPDVVRGDALVEFSIEPVDENPSGSATLYSSIFEDTDILTMGLGNFDEPPTGGTIALQANGYTTNLTAIPATVTAAALESALNIAIAAGGGGGATKLCSVTLVQTGFYLLTGTTNAAIPSGFFAVTGVSALFPLSTASFMEADLGSSSTPYRVYFQMTQNALCFATATTPLPAAEVTVTLVQAGSGTENKIQRIDFSDSTYGGSATLHADAGGTDATCGTITLGMSATTLGAVLVNNAGIKYNSPDGTADNVAITILSYRSYVIEFVGTLGLDDSNSIDIPNYDVQGAKGLSGVINYNTTELYAYSRSVAGDTVTLKRQIQVTKASGEIRTLYIDNVTIDKNVLNFATSTPVPAASYYTKTESDNRYARRDSDSAVLIGVISGASIAQKARLLPITNGAKLQASTDGSTWQDFLSYTAS